MKQILLFATTVALLLWAVGMGVGGVAAQETANETTGPDCLESIDSETCVTDWSYESGTFVVEFHSEDRTQIAYAEGGQMEEGSGQFATSTVSAPGGESTHQIEIRNPHGGTALTFATAQSQREGAGAYISTGMTEENPFRHFGGESGLFSGVFLTVGLAGLGGWYVVRSEHSGVVDA